MEWKRLIKELSSLIKEERERGERKQRYSITGDIISYLRCPRQYCFVKIKGFVPSTNLQFWYGRVLHQSLFRMVSLYKRKGNLLEEDVRDCFERARESLEKAGIEAEREELSQKALSILLRFNEVNGESFYRRVISTEFSLEKDLGDFIVYGVIDALLETKEKEEGFSSVEIWDYKGQNFSERSLKKHVEQISVYAYLYYLKTGSYPVRGVIYFLNELLREPRRAPFVVDFRTKDGMELLRSSLNHFKAVAREIDKKRKTETNSLSNVWKPPEDPDPATCSICDFRWDCPAVSYKL
jgi:putative RecB family exonuclease